MIKNIFKNFNESFCWSKLYLKPHQTFMSLSIWAEPIGSSFLASAGFNNSKFLIFRSSVSSTKFKDYNFQRNFKNTKFFNGFNDKTRSHTQNRKKGIIFLKLMIFFKSNCREDFFQEDVVNIFANLKSSKILSLNGSYDRKMDWYWIEMKKRTFLFKMVKSKS